MDFGADKTLDPQTWMVCLEAPLPRGDRDVSFEYCGNVRTCNARMMGNVDGLGVLEYLVGGRLMVRRYLRTRVKNVINSLVACEIAQIAMNATLGFRSNLP